MDDASKLTERMAQFIREYRAAGLEPGEMMVEVGRAFPGSTMSHYAIALTLAKRTGEGMATGWAHNG